MPSNADQSAEERTARKFLADLRALGPRIAKFKVPVDGTKKVSRKTERELYWTKDPAVDVQALWSAAITAGVEMGMDEQTAIQRAQPNIAIALYPERQKLIQAGERHNDVKAQIAYDRRLAAAGPPEGLGQDG